MPYPDHNVPDVEPPLGTVAVFSIPGFGGPASHFPMLVRTELGWTSHPDNRYGESWENLTDLPTFNKVMKHRYGRTFDAVRVRIVAVPISIEER